MDDLKMYKKKEINNYINSLDLNTDIDLNMIKKDLHEKIGEEPGIELNYVREEMLMEDGKSKKEIEKLESINITYTYTKNVDDGNGNIIEIVVPSTEKYIIG